MVAGLEPMEAVGGDRILVAGTQDDLVPDDQVFPVLRRDPRPGPRGAVAGHVEVDLAPAAAEGLLLADVPLVDRGVLVLRTDLAGEKDQFLGAVAVVVFVDDDLQAHMPEVAEPQVGHLDVVLLQGGEPDAGLAEQLERPGPGLGDVRRFHVPLPARKL